jgi:hypothetical protein
VRSSAAAAQFSTGEPDLKRIAAEADVDLVLPGTLLRSGEPFAKIRCSLR